MKRRKQLNLRISRRRSRLPEANQANLPTVSGGLAALILSPFVAYGFSLQYFAAAFDIGDGRIEADFFFRLSGVVLGMGVGALLMALGFFLLHDVRRAREKTSAGTSFWQFFGAAFAILLTVIGFWLLSASFEGWGAATTLIREVLDA
ncbi:hypothetical protein [uncultured Roseobacter sp.]|uniref:hypothetical protein n=1 Tax=uncultured Roseobacter sp. TaxID=114847 RepID=UPI00261ECCC9|nr:hypothetical protein [uncultured Roseobacter sp.]